MRSLSRIVYASVATPYFAEHEIPGLLKQSRGANAKRRITGTLLYIDGTFLHVLEGESSMVEAVYATILRDRRHTNVSLIARGPLSRRDFDGRSMEFATLHPEEAGELIGECAFFDDASWVGRMDQPRVQALLKSLDKRHRQVASPAAPAADPVTKPASAPQRRVPVRS